MRLSLLLMITLHGLLYGQVEKSALLGPSNHPFHQMNYLSSQRQWSAADSMLDLAIHQYQKEGKQDSVMICYLQRAQMLGLSGALEKRRDLVNDLASDISVLQLPKVDLFHLFLQAEIAFDDQAYSMADSIYDLALALGETSFGRCYDFKPRLYLGKAIIAYFQFRLQEMYEFAKKALQCNLEIYQVNDVRQTSIFNLMGAACYEKNYFEEAIQNYRAALQINRSSANEPYSEFHLLMNIGNAQKEQNKFQLAAQSLEQALEIVQQDSSLHTNLGMVYYNLASCLYGMGYYHRTRDYALEALRASEELDPTPPYISFIFSLLGKCYGKLGELSAASQAMQRNYDHLQIIYGENHQGLPYAMNAHAAILKEHGEIEQALAIYERIFALVQEQGWDPNDVDLGSYLELAADCALLINDTVQATHYLHNALRTYELSTGYKQLQGSNAAATLSQLYLDKGNLDSVQTYLHLAHNILLKEKSPSNINHLIALRAWPNFRRLEDILATKVDYRLAQFKMDQDEAHLVKAQDEIDQIMQLLSPDVLAYLESDDLTQLIDQYISKYDQAIRYYTIRYDFSRNNDHLYEALMLVEETKDVSRKIASQRSVQLQSESMGSSILQQEEFLRTNLKRIREEMFAHAPRDSIKEEQLRDSLFNYQRKMDLFRADLAKSSPKYYRANYERSAPDFDAVHAYAQKNKVNILDFFWGTEYLYVFLLNEEGINFEKLGAISDLDLLIDQALSELRQFKETSVLRTLYQQLLAPIADQLTTERLVVIPDGKLHFLPFEALQTALGHFIVERKTIWYAHSIDHLMSGSDEDYSQELLSIAPGFSDPLKAQLNQQLEADLVDNFRRKLFQPNALRITRSLAKNFKGTFLLESDATEHNFRTSIDNQGIIHLATHAHLDDQNPMYSRFSLVPSDDEHDGFLHAYEIVNLPLKAELAVLPACETGVGKIHRGEGVTSLSHAFRASGCNNILMSLWVIDEQQSMGLIEEFYTQLKEGYSGADALTRAKRNYLETATGPLRNPAYWSALVLTGNGLERNSMSRFTWIVLGFLGLMGFCIWLFNHRHLKT